MAFLEKVLRFIASRDPGISQMFFLCILGLLATLVNERQCGGGR
ncbi:MAG: hypothetical protein AAB738_01150 [Patescibacteria group bacterium]